MTRNPWLIRRRWVTAIILGALWTGSDAGIIPVATGQGNRFDCVVHQTKANGDPDWTSREVIAPRQSLYGCEGWLYAMALRRQRIVYGEWGSRTLDAWPSGRIAEWNDSQKKWVPRIPDYMKDLINDQMQSVNKFWAGRFSGSAVSYTGPSVTRILVEGVACTNRVTRTSSFYCRVDHTIYVGQGLLEIVLSRGGNITPALVLAHEWGHHIQWLLDILDTYNQKNVEIQADCFAGVYAADLEGRGMLDPGDVRSAANLMFYIGDGPDSGQLSPWFDKAAHGSGEERVTAFGVGFKEGISGCRKLR